jgi:lipopolysaccharide/colanic/teichoic acid biosynthesis glycosyltransferase
MESQALPYLDPYTNLLKRSVDIALSLLLILLLSPVFVIVAFMVGYDGSPVFFVQKRIGKDGRIFHCYKFRSMWMDADRYLVQYLAYDKLAAAEWSIYQKVRYDARVTRIGRWLRRISVDELPQLFNVLIGDMSLVGPRPITPEQQKYYSDNLIYYDTVRPGITGPWQVSGRNRLTFAERIQLERDYICGWSLC